jgi:hypothetical protein
MAKPIYLNYGLGFELVGDWSDDEVGQLEAIMLGLSDDEIEVLDLDESALGGLCWDGRLTL